MEHWFFEKFQEVGVVGLFESTFNFSYTVFMWPSWLLSLASRSRQKIFPGGSIWWLFGMGSRSRQNQSQEARFDDFLALALEVDKTIPRRLDLMTFWPWLRKETKPTPEDSIWWLSGLADPNPWFWTFPKPQNHDLYTLPKPFILFFDGFILLLQFFILFGET